MNKKELIIQFTRGIIRKVRSNEVSPTQIASTLITAALNACFVNESCKSTGQISKSQVIYTKIKGKSIKEVHTWFQQNTKGFVYSLKQISRNRLFILSFDTTKEAFYGDVSKAEDNMYLHKGSIAKGSEYYYEYLTVAITGSVTPKYILDAVMVPVGCYMEDYVSAMIDEIRLILPLEVILFDRGFGNWGVIHKLQNLHIPYLIFWKKQGNWYQKHFNHLQEGGWKKITKKGVYNRNKTNHHVTSSFVLIKQLAYNDEKYDWVFATNLKKNNAAAYVKRYKKRWGIETIYRVTDNIRILTTSTKGIIRYFLFVFTCLVYNIWRFFQLFLGEEFTLSNHKTNMIIFMAKHGLICPTHYERFELIAKRWFNVG
jgi:hypothetical protein